MNEMYRCPFHFSQLSICHLECFPDSWSLKPLRVGGGWVGGGKRGPGGKLNSISQPSALPAVAGRQRENAREGWFKEREGEINNDNKHTIHLRRAAKMEKKNTHLWCKSVLLCLVTRVKIFLFLRRVFKHDIKMDVSCEASWKKLQTQPADLP